MGSDIDYIKDIEAENERLQILIHQSTWFHGVERIIAPYKDGLSKHPNWTIDAGWFWIKEAREGRPLMCRISYSGPKSTSGMGWHVFDGGRSKLRLEIYNHCWFCGPLESPKDD